MLGLSKLIEGVCYCNLGKFEEGVTSFRECLNIRKHLPNIGDYSHVSACSQYELGTLLIRHQEVHFKSLFFCLL